MWQLIADKPVHPRACDRAQKCNGYNRQSAPYKRKKRPRTGARNGPAEAEYQPAVHVAPGKLLFGDDYGFAISSFEIKPLDQPNSDHSYNYCAANNAVHVKRL